MYLEPPLLILISQTEPRYRDWLPLQTEAKQEEGIALMEMYRTWFKKNLIPVANEDGCSKALLVLLWSNGELEYRDIYRTSEQKFTGTGFFFYNVSPYAGVPRIIVPGFASPQC